MRGIDRLIAEETGMQVHVAEDPLSCVAIGTGRMLDMIHDDPEMRRVLERASRT